MQYLVQQIYKKSASVSSLYTCSACNMFSVGHIPLVHSPILYILCTISILGSLKISTHNVTDEKNSSSIAVFGVKKLVLQIELSRKIIVFQLYGIFRRSEISFFGIGDFFCYTSLFLANYISADQTLCLSRITCTRFPESEIAH